VGRWVRAAARAEVPPGEGRSLKVDDRWVALFHDPERGFLAIDDACPHEGTPLGDGAYHAGNVICGSHSWVFDVTTGRCRSMPGVSVACYATRPAGEDVEIELPDGPPGRPPDAGEAQA
jgi:nitrite reductase/ring-hydroxylating ferredoxin subunit